MTTTHWSRPRAPPTRHRFLGHLGSVGIPQGCDHCYAENWAKRHGSVRWGPGQERKLISDANWRQPFKWNKEATAAGLRFRVFCASLADVFDNEVPGVWPFRLWTLIRQTPHLYWDEPERPSNSAKNRLNADSGPPVFVSVTMNDFGSRRKHSQPIGTLLNGHSDARAHCPRGC